AGHAGAVGEDAIFEDAGAVELDALRACLHLGIGNVAHDSEFADPGLPTVAVESVDVRCPFLDEVAVIGPNAELDQLARNVERLTGLQVDAAGDAAFDQVGGLVLVDVDALQQFRGNVAPVQSSAAVR